MGNKSHLIYIYSYSNMAFKVFQDKLMHCMFGDVFFVSRFSWKLWDLTKKLKKFQFCPESLVHNVA